MYKALLRPAHSLAALPSAARRCTSTPRSSRAGRGARPATPRPPHMLCTSILRSLTLPPPPRGVVTPSSEMALAAAGVAL